VREAQVEAGSRAIVFSVLLVLLKTYANLWEGENQVIPIDTQ
jgi:hypothetical protein